MTRQAKTPKQRAEEALAAANRVVVRLDHKVDALTTELAAVRTEHAAAVARQQHLRQHPDLQPNPSSTSNGDPA